MSEKKDVSFEIYSDSEKMLDQITDKYDLPDKSKALRCLLDYVEEKELNPSYVFPNPKDAQKKAQSAKKQVDELKKILSSKEKNVNQLKGGSSTSEFFSTYSTFLIHNVQVYPDEVLQSRELKADHPINLKDPKLLADP